MKNSTAMESYIDKKKKVDDFRSSEANFHDRKEQNK